MTSTSNLRSFATVTDRELTTIELQLKLVDCILDCTYFRYFSSAMSHTTPGVLVIILLIQGTSTCIVIWLANTLLYLNLHTEHKSETEIEQFFQNNNLLL